MDRLRIRGGNPLHGEIPISGAKNAALPLMAAALLSADGLTLKNVPDLADIASMSALLEVLGAEISIEPDIDGRGRTMTMRAKTFAGYEAPYDIVRKMRASVLVLGPLVARGGEAKVSLPGGCAIGNRPVDFHLMVLEEMGADIVLEAGYIHARAPNGLKGARIAFPMVSVGATENALMAAALADGDTTLLNAAREPEIGDLAACLIAMGAKIEGVGTDTLQIQGVPTLGHATHPVVADRIETGTFAMAAAMTGGDVELIGGRLSHIASSAKILETAGIAFTETERGFRVTRANGRLEGVDVMTEPYPGFPTDLQAQFMALMCTASGASMVTETIFENRFMHVPELARMGANINVHGASAMIRGVERLKGAPVMATDLRASVSLVLAGLTAEDETIVNRIYHLDRGYERVERKLGACGAEIVREREP
jgi:UDP-N-acetylglucosamine 1-carboxyvinyltransferase